ncbi:2OG-Fe(II) oxygenase superfamily [Verticillium dahliae]|nr:2OG-Fe(II) oxygenase superfamily [Verticillium dahliae]
MKDEFTKVPVVDYSLSQHPAGKAEFLSQLRNAIVNVGFFYLSNHSIPEEVQQAVLEQTNAFFSLPLQKKLDIDMAHSKHFLGYNGMNSEKTVAITGQNESVFFGPEYPPPHPAELAYLNLHGPSQWPDQNAVPDFRQAVETYRSAVQDLATSFISLTSEALGLEANSFSWLFEDTPFSRLNLRMYPAPLEESNGGARHGIAPHKDSSFMTYLLQGGDHNWLEVQNRRGNWIAVPANPRTLVVNIAACLEIYTRKFVSRRRIWMFRTQRRRPVYGGEAVTDSGTFFSGIFDDSAVDTVFVSMLTSFRRDCEGLVSGPASSSLEETG